MKVFLIISGSIVAICAALTAMRTNTILAVYPAFIGYILSLILWLLANAENSNLMDNPPPQNLIGGDPNKDLGSTEGFKVN